MANKAITELNPRHINQLPPLSELFDEDLLAVHHQSQTMKMTGRQWKAYAVAATEKLANDAKDYADAAENSAKNAKESENKAKDHADRAQHYSGHAPIIKDNNWWTWDYDQQAYVDTGQPSRGNLMYACFEIDAETGTLYMYTDDQYAGPKFRLNDRGEMEVVLEHA